MLTGEITLLQFFLFLGGISLFLYGMQLMGDGLQAAAGSKLQRILGALTKRTIYGVALGAGVTSILQSSSATTVMTVGLVNAGLMNLQQAFGIVMGANIGTTITAQLIALYHFAPCHRLFDPYSGKETTNERYWPSTHGVWYPHVRDGDDEQFRGSPAS